MSEHCFFCGHALDAGQRCERCGAVRDARDEKRVRGRCPRCQVVRLFPFALDTVALQTCGRCKGCFLSTSDWDALLDAFARAPLPEIVIGDASAVGDESVDRSPYRRAAPVAPKDSPPPDLTETVRCPTCDEMMDRLEFAGISGVIVDVCKLHGVWLDAGELERVVTVIQRQLEEPLLERPEPEPLRPAAEPIDPDAMASLVESLRESAEVMADNPRPRTRDARRDERLTVQLGRALGALKRRFRGRRS